MMLVQKNIKLLSVLFPPLQKVLGAEMRRKGDTVTVSKYNKWRLPNNTEQIEQADNECRQHRALDWVNAKPFMGPLERFQWRVSLTYTTCAIFRFESSLSLSLSLSLSSSKPAARATSKFMRICYFAEHISEQTDNRNPKLAGAGNPLVR